MTSYPRPPIPANRFKTKLGPTENQTHTCDQKRGAFSLPRGLDSSMIDQTVSISDASRTGESPNPAFLRLLNSSLVRVSSQRPVPVRQIPARHVQARPVPARQAPTRRAQAPAPQGPAW